MMGGLSHVGISNRGKGLCSVPGCSPIAPHDRLLQTHVAEEWITSQSLIASKNVSRNNSTRSSRGRVIGSTWSAVAHQRVIDESLAGFQVMQWPGGRISIPSNSDISPSKCWNAFTAATLGRNGQPAAKR